MQPPDDAPLPLTVEVLVDPGASPGNLVVALAELLLDRARNRVQAAEGELPRRRPGKASDTRFDGTEQRSEST